MKIASLRGDSALLLDKGADNNALEMDKRSTLYIACERRNISFGLVELLLNRGSSLCDAFLSAVINSKCPLGVIQLLLDRGGGEMY